MMPRLSLLLTLVVSACSTPNPIGTVPGTDAGPPCSPSSATETMCSDGVDEDCDGYPDCLDVDCEGQTCGGAGDATCTAGACVAPGAFGELPRIDNVRVTVRGDTAIVEFEPIAGARDYRIFPLPAEADVLVGAGGEQVVQNAIYRCAGDRPFRPREEEYGAGFELSLGWDLNRPDVYDGYARSESESILGYVFNLPAAGRQPVYRMADPNGGGGFFNADWVVPIYSEANSADYVVGTEERDRLRAAGWRDDGIAFYVADEGTRPVFRSQYDNHNTFFYVPGPEADARADGDPAEVVDQGERFRVLETQTGDAVALHRVTYTYAHTFDVLAAGDARYERVLHQGNTPLWSVTWPGITESTTFVVEALDAGCPFPGGYIAPQHVDADRGEDGVAWNEPSITLDEARLASGEVFVNGQHDPANRPRPIARAFVTIEPAAHPEMEFYETFDVGGAWPALEMGEDNNGRSFRNADWAIDTTGCSDNFAFGPQLGQFHLGFADWGSSCNVSITPRQVPTHLTPGEFLHVRMSTDIPSTGRRYPQIMITTVPLIEDWDGVQFHVLPVHNGERMAEGASIVVQPFASYHEMQIQFCDQRAWGVNIQCPQANVYGHHAGNYEETWEMPWTPVPVLGDVAGHDRPVQFDVYASTERVYVYADGRPAACAVLPEGRMPVGDVTVAYRAVLYHSGIDESVVPEDSPHQYLRRYSLSHDDHTMDDFGIDNDVAIPGWDEVALPCGTRWYGGG